MASGGRKDGPNSSMNIKGSLSPENIESLTKDELLSRLMEMKLYVEELENRSEVRSEDSRLRQHQSESQRRENVLFMRLTAKEQEVQEFLSQLEDLRTSLGGGLRNALLDPVVNSIFQKMREELKQTKEKMEQSQDELNAWKFTPDSTTGKRLMAKCKGLIQENEELGKTMESGRLAQLEGELKLSKKQTEDLVEGQSEVDEFLVELDEDMEGLQATVVYLQKQLEASRKENGRLREVLERRRTAQPLSMVDETSSRSPTPSRDEPPILTDKLARHIASAVRRHEAKYRTGTLTFVDDTPDWPGGELTEESEKVVENGGRTPTMEDSFTPASPPPRKMPRLDSSGSTGHYSPKSPEIGVDSNLEQEEDEEDPTSNSLHPKERRTRKEGLGLFDKFTLTQNGILEGKAASAEH